MLDEANSMKQRHLSLRQLLTGGRARPLFRRLFKQGVKFGFRQPLGQEIAVGLVLHAVQHSVQSLACHRLGNGEIKGIRSEEHTSELQSLMRISYAVFCLQNKKQKSIRT